MKLSDEKKLQYFEANKSGLDERIKNGFEWPCREKGLLPAKFIKLEESIGSKAMDNTEKAAYISHITAIDSERIKDCEWNFSSSPEMRKKEEEHFKACKRKLVDFDNEEAFKKIKKIADDKLFTINEIKKNSNRNHAEGMEAHKHTHYKVEPVPVMVHENQTEEGKACLQSRGMLTGIKATPEEADVYKAYYNDGLAMRSQSEVAKITKLSKGQVRNRAKNLNKKARNELIVWNRTPERGKGYEADLEQNRQWETDEHRERHKPE